jgi:hypothetical protein
MSADPPGTVTHAEVATLGPRIAGDGFVFVEGAAMRELLSRHGSLRDWDAFAASWNDLQLDTYMADGGRYRRRRHALFAIDADGSVARLPHGPHYQTLDYNPLHGGIARWFEPVTTPVADGAVLQTILRGCHAGFCAAAVDRTAWAVEVHQFRIEAQAGAPGLPTPEGVHRDGVDYVLAMMVCRHNIASGTTTIHAAGGRALGGFTLAQPFDAALVDDRRVWHGVTPVEPLDIGGKAYRDVLVVTFRRQAA